MLVFEKLLNICGYRATPAGIVRIALWTFAFLALAGALLPEKKRIIPFSENVSGYPISPRITLPSDPAFVTEEKTAPKGKQKIAWISDSTSVIYKPGARFLDFSAMKENKLLPLETLEKLEQDYKGSLYIDLYIRLSLRSLETYTLTQLALNQDPDMIILTLNPFFVLNNHALFKGKSHFARASQVWAANPDTWPLILLLPEPSDLLWALAGRHFKIFSTASTFAHDVQSAKDVLWHTAFPPLQSIALSETQDRTDNTMQESALIFWVSERNLKGDMSSLINERHEAINAQWYRQLLRLSDFTRNSLNNRLLHKTIQKIKLSGKKAILYLAPVSENLKNDREAWEIYQRIKLEIDALDKIYGNGNLKIIAHIPDTALVNTVFVENDDVHLNDAGGIPNFIAEQVKNTLPKLEMKENKK